MRSVELTVIVPVRTDTGRLLETVQRSFVVQVDAPEAELRGSLPFPHAFEWRGRSEISIDRDSEGRILHAFKRVYPGRLERREDGDRG